VPVQGCTLPLSLLCIFSFSLNTPMGKRDSPYIQSRLIPWLVRNLYKLWVCRLPFRTVTHNRLKLSSFVWYWKTENVTTDFRFIQNTRKILESLRRNIHEQTPTLKAHCSV